MEVEEASATYESLSTCPKKFNTLDAKLSAALTEICNGELGRKVSLRTEEEAKVRKRIRGRQILWIVYEEYRVNEEAGALRDITDLMKVTLKRDQCKVDHLSTFMGNWFQVLAGMKTTPEDATLQVMLYEQVKHIPCLTADIAAYDRAAIGSDDRLYTFLTKAIQRVLEH